MIRVLVADDSETMRSIMRRALESDPEIRVVAEAEDGERAVREAGKHQPDVITMDILMPGMNGLDATRRIMEDAPVPIVMVSAVGDSEEQRITFEAMDAGAVWFVRKPRGAVTADWDGWSRSLRSVVKSMAEVKVVSRRARREPAPKAAPVTVIDHARSVVAVASSTGGPAVLQRIFRDLPAGYPIPILVCQHIAEGFVKGLIEWMAPSLKVPVRIGGTISKLEPGVTFSPDSGHLEVAGKGWLRVAAPADDDDYTPSANRLFSSVAKHYQADAVGVIMTGMGRDGAQGLHEMWEAGAVTVGQDEQSSLIYGMPRVAKEIGGVRHELNPGQIAELLIRLPGPGGDGDKK